jgi:hypothetical protein
MIKKYIIILFIVQGLNLFATNQNPDVLLHNGKKYDLYVFLMENYFDRFPEKRPHPTNFYSTALWRCYIATFEIIQNELWIIEIKKEDGDYLSGEYDYKETSVINECLDGKDKIKIDWFNGILVFPQNNWGYDLIHENYTIIEIQNGNLTKELNLNNEQFLDFIEGQFERYKQSDHFLEKYLKIYKELFVYYDVKVTEAIINRRLKNEFIYYLEKILE